MSLDIYKVFHMAKLQKVHNILNDNNRVVVVVDGVIGAGKTTTIKEIEKRFEKINNDNENNKNYKKIKIKAIYEPVELWKTTGALEYFYKDIAKNAYSFQTFTYITRIASVIDEIYDNPDADIYILERSIWTDRYIFMELLKDSITKLEMTMYMQWCDMWAYILPMRVDKWVLLNTSLDESLKRIEIRDRNGEKSGVSIEYQTNLYKKHSEFYNKLKNDGKPVVIIESKVMDENIIDNDEKIDNIIEKILDIDMNKFKYDKELKNPSIISWLLNLF